MYNPQLDTFLTVANLGSFSKAGEALYISTPAVIQQINLLEERLNIKLFERSNHGVHLTKAGESFYKDTKEFIQLAHTILERTQKIATPEKIIIRIGTSLLYKCRLLPKLIELLDPNKTKYTIEFIPIIESQPRPNAFQALGKEYDLREGVICSPGWDNYFDYLELDKTPICCALSPKHPLSKKKNIDLKDLLNEQLILPIKGLSKEIDQFRQDILKLNPKIKIIDSSYYGIDTFTSCELNQYILITQKIYADIHPNLITVPLKEKYELPYGLIYSKSPSDTINKLIQSIKNNKS